MGRAVGEYTGYDDMFGNPIHMGDEVRIGGLYFEIDKNLFNGLYVVDGDTGQDFLVNVHKQVVVMELKMSYSEIWDKLFELRRKFITKHAISPNRVYLGSGVMEILTDHLRNNLVPTTYPSYERIWTIFNLNVVEVVEHDHISVGRAVE